MNALSRRDPIREMMTMQSAMDRLFESAFGESIPGWSRGLAADLALDVSENENEYVVKASLPGINPDDLEVTYNANTLTIRGETKAEEEKEGTRYHVRERRFGSFSRSINLPTSIQADAIQANYEAGVLTLRLPKAEEARPKRIQIRSGAGAQMLEG